ncbi:acyl-CoA N-acyltransferase [Daldinia decipiens]|uniref:acyl-CoA N-acyltransferase n=1 Tax=Daldinia decipiens TaxID=326647 RepID=UPI0020C29167|nr:acyl-CoA N-acyltransferase [Daldinia decipiens]KAI1657674.1 acyl-CoA N-acyltransferase [Daldinia decipiens]
MARPPKIKVKTYLPTQPFPPNAERKPIRTERLVIRPFTEEDLDAIYAIRTQPEVMHFSAVGQIDASKDETRTSYLACYLPPNDIRNYHNVLCLASTGELIGMGGMPKTDLLFGWPEVGYMLKKEYWGQGYATEFLRAFVDHWWTLPRSEAEIEVAAESVDRSGEVPEMLSAIADDENLASKHVLEKAGFQKFTRWTEPDTRVGVIDDIALVGFVLESPGQKVKASS